MIVRQKELYDGALPSGNSIAALDLLRVGRLTMEKDFEKKAEALFQAFSNQIQQSPEAYPQLLIALDFALGPTREIIIAGDETLPETQSFLRAVSFRFLPNKVIALYPADQEKAADIEKLVPFIENQLPIKGKPAAYVCKNYVCDFPVTELSALEKLLEKGAT